MIEGAVKLPTDESCNPFTDEFVATVAQEFDLDSALLKTSLAEAITEYGIAAPYSKRIKDWRKASDKLKNTHNFLEKALKYWRSNNKAYWKTFTDFSYGEYPAEQFEAELQKLIDSLEEILEFATFPRGNPGLSSDNSKFDLYIYRGVVAVLDELWVKEKGRHLGHGFLQDLPGEDDKEEHRKLGDAGLLFAHACLKKLEPTMTRKSTSSVIRWMKRS